jgi:hypothetical protein
MKKAARKILRAAFFVIPSAKVFTRAATSDRITFQKRANIRFTLLKLK